MKPTATPSKPSRKRHALLALGGALMFAGVHDNAFNMMRRGGLLETIDEKNFFWSSDQAIVEAEKRGCRFCPQE